MYVKNWYTVHDTPLTDPDAKREYENNANAKHVILSGLSNTEFVKVIHFKSAKETWDKMKMIFEGDTKVKEAKLQNLRVQFESLKMKEEEKNVKKDLERIYNMKWLSKRYLDLSLQIMTQKSLPLKKPKIWPPSLWMNYLDLYQPMKWEQ